jgi:hypothetical protein
LHIYYSRRTPTLFAIFSCRAEEEDEEREEAGMRAGQNKGLPDDSLWTFHLRADVYAYSNICT